jgi:hypothetical protein
VSSRPGFAGVTRICPHCKATILANSAVCPSCKHHLRFDSAATSKQQVTTALRVEGTVVRPADGEAWEYSMVLSIRNERGEEIDRKLVGVGAMRAGERRTFALAVEIYGGAEDGKPSRSH